MDWRGLEWTGVDCSGPNRIKFFFPGDFAWAELRSKQCSGGSGSAETRRVAAGGQSHSIIPARLQPALCTLLSEGWDGSGYGVEPGLLTIHKKRFTIVHALPTSMVRSAHFKKGFQFFCNDL